MDLREAIEQRRSIRGYRQDPVPQEVLAQILDLARLSPSGLNCQPWEFVVLVGESLERARRANLEAFAADTDISPYVAEYSLTAIYRDRQVELEKELFRLAGIARDDKKKRQEWVARGVRFFDAPALILVCIDKRLYDGTSNPMCLFDLGIVTQTITLLAIEHGLGTCVQFQAAWYPDALSRAIDLPESKAVIMGVAVGYPDWDFPPNRIRTAREPLDRLVIWRD